MGSTRGYSADEPEALQAIRHFTTLKDWMEANIILQIFQPDLVWLTPKWIFYHGLLNTMEQ